ncbi:MAG: NADH-quinone oxidoreductase subunit NuoG [Candidatus Acidiferrales bacterium]
MALVTICIDDKRHEVDTQKNILEVCLSLRLDLPYFCWHPALGSVGACRQCAVKLFHNEQDTKGRIVMACMTPVTKGMRVSIDDPEARKFRAGVIEGLMENHPHDCPVCDEGGECHLQDMTVMTGHDYRSYRFPKRTFRNQNLGPFLNHEMNRCIQCYRCVRFYREYAGGNDFNAFKLRDIVYFGRKEDGVLESEFAGNLVEVCPTGVFTDKTLKRHYTRKWDLTMAPSICVHCGLGCNTTAGERYGLLRRIVNRYNGMVNGYFLCDRGRYGYEFVNTKRRIRTPILRMNETERAVSREQALDHLTGLLSASQKVIGIGSPRASLEANFALRTLVGDAHFHTGMSDDEARLVSGMLGILRAGPARTPSMREIESCDAVLVLGEDVSNTAPRLGLSLRQLSRQRPLEEAKNLHIPLWQDHAVRELLQEQRGPFFIASVNATRLDDVATDVYRAAPDDIARLGFAIAHAIDSAAPDVQGLLPGVRALARRIATVLLDSQKPLVISGPSCRNEAVIQAAANVARALCRAGKASSLTFAMPESNSAGLAMLGGAALSAAFEAVKNGAVDTVIALENDLFRRAPAVQVDALLKSAVHVVVLDSLENETTARGELVLPAGTFAESEGTIVNNEGRSQRFFRALPPEGDVQESWKWLAKVIPGKGGVRPWQVLDDIIVALTRSIPSLAAIAEAAPMSAFRMEGAKVPREPHRYSGRTSILASINVSEPKPPRDPDSPLSFTMEGTSEQPPAALLPFFWTPGWNSIQAVNKFQTEIAAALEGGDPGARLIEPASDGSADYFASVPPAFEPRSNEWFVVPLHHIYGSEELSNCAPAVAELAPRPYLALNETDANKMHVSSGDRVELTLDGLRQQLEVKIAPAMPSGVAGIPAGLLGAPTVNLPVWSRISGGK